MADDTNTAPAAERPVYRFVWVEEAEPSAGGQWLAYPPDGMPDPVALNDVVLAWRRGQSDEDPLPVHVAAVFTTVAAAGSLEDRLFPDVTRRAERALARADAGQPELPAGTPEAEQVRQSAEALEKLAADLAELVEEQLDGGSLATLPPDSTRALCQSVQAAWRLRRLVDPPGPLYL